MNFFSEDKMFTNIFSRFLESLCTILQQVHKVGKVSSQLALGLISYPRFLSIATLGLYMSIILSTPVGLDADSRVDL